MKQEFGLINLALVPLREKASHRSEMTTQLLFGDCFKILEIRDEWVYIQTTFDQYEGWISRKQFIAIDVDTLVKFDNFKLVSGLSMQHSAVNLNTLETVHIVAGSSLPEMENGQFQINKITYQFQGTTVKPDLGKFVLGIDSSTRFYLNSPYLWGGRSPFGIDCSGFSQLIFKQFGFRLKRDAYLQATQGTLVSFLEETQPGDLAFFDNEEGRITHVGILLNNTEIIHSSGKVRIDLIDNEGIFDKESKRYTHKLRIVKRMIATPYPSTPQKN